jgi:hypothetical protein
MYMCYISANNVMENIGDNINGINDVVDINININDNNEMEL